MVVQKGGRGAEIMADAQRLEEIKKSMEKLRQKNAVIPVHEASGWYKDMAYLLERLERALLALDRLLALSRSAYEASAFYDRSLEVAFIKADAVLETGVKR